MDEHTKETMDAYTNKLEEVWKLLEDSENRHLHREAMINLECDSVKVIVEGKKVEQLQKDNPSAVERANEFLLKNEQDRAKALEVENKRYEAEKPAIETRITELNVMHEGHLNERIALDKQLVETQAKVEKLLEDAPAQNSDPAVRAASWIETIGKVAEKAIEAVVHAVTGATIPGIEEDFYKMAAAKAELAIEGARATGSDTVKYLIPKTSQEIDQLVAKSVQEDIKQAPAKLVSEQAKELESVKNELTKQFIEKERPDNERSR
jgi:hypothetical protein